VYIVFRFGCFFNFSCFKEENIVLVFFYGEMNNKHVQVRTQSERTETYYLIEIFFYLK